MFQTKGSVTEWRKLNTEERVSQLLPYSSSDYITAIKWAGCIGYIGNAFQILA
jgi:hypothetical protein